MSGLVGLPTHTLQVPRDQRDRANTDPLLKRK